MSYNSKQIQRKTEFLKLRGVFKEEVRAWEFIPGDCFLPPAQQRMGRWQRMSLVPLAASGSPSHLSPGNRFLFYFLPTGHGWRQAASVLRWAMFLLADCLWPGLCLRSLSRMHCSFVKPRCSGCSPGLLYASEGVACRSLPGSGVITGHLCLLTRCHCSRRDKILDDLPGPR